VDAIDAIRGFKMYRGRLDPRKLEEDHLLRILDAARWAPSGHNSQPWEFVVIDDPELIHRIAAISTGIFDDFLSRHPHLVQWAHNYHPWMRWSREELERRGDGGYVKHYDRAEWEELASLTDEAAIREWMIAMFGSRGKSSKVISTAPCLIFTLLDTERKIPDYSADLQALTSAGAAMQNMRLAAWALGIGVHEQAVLYDLPESRAAMRELLGIPARYRIVGGMRLGYRGKSVKSGFSHVRKPVAEIMHRNAY